MGKGVGEASGHRLGKAIILELGGNNVITVSNDADLAVPDAVFGTAGTTAQQCMSTQRLLIHNSFFVMSMLTPKSLCTNENWWPSG